MRLIKGDEPRGRVVHFNVTPYPSAEWVGEVIAFPQVSGLHHRYSRLAA